jgi:hypothetical protein
MAVVTMAAMAMAVMAVAATLVAAMAVAAMAVVVAAVAMPVDSLASILGVCSSDRLTFTLVATAPRDNHRDNHIQQWAWPGEGRKG